MKKVLVVDDELDMANLIKSNLEKGKYEVICALSGKEGIEKAKEIHPDIITLDILMPGMDGFQVLETLKNDPELSRIPVILISIVADAKKEKGFNLGAVDYIKKPVDFESLSSSINKVMENLSQKSTAEKNILIIDDEKNMAYLAKSFLIKRGFEVSCALSGYEGLNLARENKPDLIILDLAMPGMDGFEVIKKLKSNKETNSIPIIILTSSISEKNKEKCLLLGAAEYLDKSFFSEDTLVKEIEEHLKELDE